MVMQETIALCLICKVFVCYGNGSDECKAHAKFVTNQTLKTGLPLQWKICFVKLELSYNILNKCLILTVWLETSALIRYYNIV